jgi:hypothetical protein
MSSQGISYELAFELRNAGFPFDFGNQQVFDTPPAMFAFDKYPTLEELIEACYASDVQIKLESRLPISSTKNRPRWSAVAEWWEIDGVRWMSSIGNSISKIEAHGSTPTEAVAYLWLALHKVQ